MPSNWLYIDTNFPAFTSEESVEQKIDTIQNYLFMLVEQLRYSLRNLDGTNMNQAALNQYTRSITDPINITIRDVEKGLENQIDITAEGLRARISNAEGDITALQARATGIEATISNAQGDITALQARATGIEATISNAQGDITALQARATGIEATISNAQGDITALQARATGIEATISDAQGNIADLQVAASGLSTAVSDNEGRITTLQETVAGFQLKASDNGDSTTLTLTSKGISINTTFGSVSAAVRSALQAQDIAMEIANGEYAGGTFIDGQRIYAPEIYAGSGGQVIGISDDGIQIFANADPHAVLHIYGMGSSGFLDRAVIATQYNRLIISAPYVDFNGVAIMDFGGADVQNLTLYFS